MMVKRGIFALIIFFSVFALSLVSSAPINDNLHLNIQAINSSGDITTGTFLFTFNISTTNDCANVVYSNFSTLTTDSRGIISYYLENTNLNYSDQYWLCYYRDNSLINVTKIAYTPYTFYANNSANWQGMDNFNTTQMSNSNGILNILESYLSTFVHSVTDAIFIKISQNVSSINTTANIQNLINSTGIYSTYNSTYATWTYNQTAPANSYTDSRIGLINTTANIQNLINGTNIKLGNVDFNNGFSGGGVSITGGNLFAQTIYVYNISSINVSTINTNGSLYPAFNNLFDIGNSNYNWRNGFFSGYINASNFNGNWIGNNTLNIQTLLAGTNISQFAFNQTAPANVYTNLQISSINNTLNIQNLYNATASIIANTSFNQNILTYNNTVYNNAAWNQSGSNIYLNNPANYVGIGTSSPSANLEINVNQNAATQINLLNPDTTDNAALSRILMGSSTSGGHYGYLAFLNSNFTGSGILQPNSTLLQANDIGGLTLGAVSVLGNINFYTGGSASANQRMIITNTGNVGIGTTNPQRLLEINGGASPGYIQIDGNNTAIIFNSTDALSTGKRWDINNIGGNLYFDETGVATRLTIQNTTGNVGIGTSSPNALLDIQSSGGTSSQININASAGTGQADLKLIAGNGATNRASRIDFINTVTDGNVPRWTIINDYNQDGTNSLSIVNGTTSSSGRVFNILQSGNVGIGTLSPNVALDVNGYARATSLKSTGRIYSTGSATYDDLGSTSGAIVMNFDPTTNYGILNARNYSNATNLPMQIGNNLYLMGGTGGNVGIGTSNPQATLNVVGTTNLTSNLTVNGGTLFVNANSNYVGIGTTNPQVLLQLQTLAGSGTSNYPIIRYNNSISAWDAGVVAVTPNPLAGYFYIADGATNVKDLVIANGTGNVGIGTTSPGATLEINAAGGIGGYTGFKLKQGTSSVQSLSMGQVTAGNGAWVGTAQYNTAGYWQTEGTAASVIQFDSLGNLLFSGNSGLTANTNYVLTSRMFINGTSGNVGIGTTSPDDILDINSASPNLGIWQSGGSVGTTSYINFGYSAGVNNISRIGTVLQSGGGGDLLFDTAATGTSPYVTKMTILRNGNVGIGTTSPTNFLTLNYNGINALLINGTSTNSIGLDIINTNANNLGWAMGTSGGGPNPNGNFFIYENGATNRLTIQNGTGNVGIGTTLPNSPLDVQTASNFHLQVFKRTDNGVGAVAIGASTDNFANWQNLSINSGGNVFLSATGGNVGIGTTNPQYTLDVLSSSATNGIHVNGTAQFVVDVNNTGHGLFGSFGTPGQDIFGISKTGAILQRFNITDNSVAFPVSHVAIGINTPQATLDVAGTSRFGAATNQHVWLESTGSGDYGSQVYLTNDLGTTQGAVKLGSAYTGFGTSGYPNFVIQRSTNSQAYGSDPSALTYTPSLVIDGSTGSVGIGTTSPLDNFMVNSSAGTAIDISRGNITYSAQLQYLTGATYNWITGLRPGDGGYSIVDSPVTATRLYIQNNTGNVGIGTTSPIAKLSVNGNITQTTAKSCSLTTDANGQIICTSDIRLKNVYGNSSYGLSQIMNITPIVFSYKEDNYTHIGFSAQNVQTVIPEATPIQGNGYLGLDVNAITATMVNAMKQQQEIINQQNDTINSMNNTINAMKQSLCSLGVNEWC